MPSAQIKVKISDTKKVEALLARLPAVLKGKARKEALRAAGRVVQTDGTRSIYSRALSGFDEYAGRPIDSRRQHVCRARRRGGRSRSAAFSAEKFLPAVRNPLPAPLISVVGGNGPRRKGTRCAKSCCSRKISIPWGSGF